MSVTRIATVVVGLALAGLAWATDGIWENPEPWVRWLIGVTSAGALIFAAFWPVSRDVTEPQPVNVHGHSANVDFNKHTAGRDITVNIGDQIHVNAGTIDPVSERDLNNFLLFLK